MKFIKTSMHTFLENIISLTWEKIVYHIKILYMVRSSVRYYGSIILCACTKDRIAHSWDVYLNTDLKGETCDTLNDRKWNKIKINNRKWYNARYTHFTPLSIPNTNMSESLSLLILK